MRARTLARRGARRREPKLRTRTVVVTLGELVEAVSAVAGDSTEAAAVVDHLLRAARAPEREPGGGS